MELFLECIYFQQRHIANSTRRDKDTASTGMVVESWPLTPGCDIAGVIEKVGPNAISPLGTPWKKGDAVFSCTRVGVFKYAAWAEYVSPCLVSIHYGSDL